MPSTRIETRKGWLGTQKREFIEAVHAALVAGILIPEGDRCVRLVEYDDDAFIVAADKGPRYCVIEICMFVGRSTDAKRRLYAELTSRLAPFGLAVQDLKVIVHDVPRENWGLRGLPASEIELGFKVDV